MTKNEFEKLEVGNYVQVTIHGQNKGKIGVVKRIRRNELYGGSVYLAPYNCEFGLSNKSNRRQKDGLTSFNHESIRYLGKSPTPLPKSDKIFYVSAMCGGDVIEWPTENFTNEELKVIDRFLDELNGRAGGVRIDSVCILDDKD